MRYLLASLFLVSTSVLAVDVIPLVIKSEDIYSNPIPFFYQPSRIIFCRGCSPEVVAQLKMWEEISTKDWATDFNKDVRSNELKEVKKQ